MYPNESDASRCIGYIQVNVSDVSKMYRIYPSKCIRCIQNVSDASRNIQMHRMYPKCIRSIQNVSDVSKCIHYPMYPKCIQCTFRVEDTRKNHDELIERVFRCEEKRSEASVTRNDLEALEKEISIDIAELRRDLRSFRKDLFNEEATLQRRSGKEEKASEIINEETREEEVKDDTAKESGEYMIRVSGVTIQN